MHLSNALTKEGADVEAGQVDNEIVAMHSQLLALRQRGNSSDSIHSAGSYQSCNTVTTLEVRQRKFAELERMRVQQQYEQQATELQLQDEETANQSKLEAEQEKVTAEEDADKSRLESEQAKLEAEQGILSAEQIVKRPKWLLKESTTKQSQPLKRQN